MAALWPSEALGSGATFWGWCWCESTGWRAGEVRLTTWSKLLGTVVGVTGLVGWLVELLGSASRVRFFLRKPRLGMEAVAVGAEAQEVQFGSAKAKGGWVR